MKMASILDRYGIKEVADVTFYELKSDETRGAPVLYLDTLKVSTIEQTAENAEARGGKGNAALISWDYGKEITVTLEDALYSAKSLAMMFGDNNGATENTAGSIFKTVWKANLVSTAEASGTTASVVINGNTVNLTNCTFYKVSGATTTSVSSGTDYDYVTGTVSASTRTIDVSANAFPGTYYVTGDTYARSEATGKDEFFQFIIPKAKVMSESNTITLEAEGDPTVFSMSLKVLRPKNGVMMQLVQYTVN
jgi:hypothetical protein